MPKHLETNSLVLTPGVKWKTIYAVDLRTREGQTVQFIRDQLSAYVGGNPDIKQMLLIERASWIVLRIALREDQLVKKGIGSVTINHENHYLAWTNTLGKILKQLHPPETDTKDDNLTYERILAEVRGQLTQSDAA